MIFWRQLYLLKLKRCSVTYRAVSRVCHDSIDYLISCFLTLFQFLKIIFNKFYLIPAEITSIGAWASSSLTSYHLPQFAWKGTDEVISTGFFHSREENNPWLRIQLNRNETITSVSVRNRLDCCGDRLQVTYLITYLVKSPSSYHS